MTLKELELVREVLGWAYVKDNPLFNEAMRIVEREIKLKTKK